MQLDARAESPSTSDASYHPKVCILVSRDAYVQNENIVKAIHGITFARARMYAEDPDLSIFRHGSNSSSLIKPFINIRGFLQS